MKYFDSAVLPKLKGAIKVSHTGVTHGFCDGVFRPEIYAELTKTFPDPKTFFLVDKANSGGGHKRFYVGPDYLVGRHFGSAYHLRSLPEVWKGVLNEAASPEFIRAISEATGVECNSLCNFGFAFGDEGSVMEPHLDGAIRGGNRSMTKSDIAFVVYLNDEVDPVSATELYDLDRKTILAKGDTMRNSWFFFKQHPNSWHGFPTVPPHHTRKILSLTFSKEPVPVSVSWSFWSHVVAKVKNKIVKSA